MIGILNSVEEGAAISQRTLEACDALCEANGVLQLILYVATVISFLMWFRRAYENVPAVAGIATKYSPGWAVGGFFVPILNVFRPYQIAREMWIATLGTSIGYGLVGFWWFLFLAMDLLASASARMMQRAQTVAAMRTATAYSIAADIASVLCAAAAVFLVLRIQRGQVSRWAGRGDSRRVF